MEKSEDLMSFVSPKYASGTTYNIDKIVLESTFIKFDPFSFENQNSLPKDGKGVEVPTTELSQQCILVSNESFMFAEEPKTNSTIDNSGSEVTVDNLKNQKEMYNTFPICSNVTVTSTDISKQQENVNNKTTNKDTMDLDGTIRRNSVSLIFSLNDLNDDNFNDFKDVRDSDTTSVVNGIFDKENVMKVELKTVRENECINNGLQTLEDCENSMLVSINNIL